MELQNGTENRIRELDKNVWEYCINMFSKLFNWRTPAANSLKSKEQDTINSIEIDKLKTYINEYRTENQKLINNNNCSEDENQAQIEIIREKGNLIENHFILIKKKELSTEHLQRLDNLYNWFKNIFKATQKIYIDDLIKCEKNKIIKDGNYNVVVRSELKHDHLYYRYNSKDKSVIILGQYKGLKSYNNSISHEKFEMKLLFENDGKIFEINEDEQILIKEPEPVKLENIELTVPSGGKPRRTRRHKNKKRRSSKQRISKK